MSPRQIGRFLLVSWWLHLKFVATARLFLFTALIIPPIFATLGFHVAGASTQRPALLVSIGAGLMGMWSSTLLSAGAIVDQQRRHGTLEPLIASPMALPLTVVPAIVASATSGMYSLAATLGWGVLLFDVSVTVSQPFLLVGCIVAMVLSVGGLGMLLAAALVRYPAAAGFSNLLEYPVWILSGMLVPIALLPGFAQWLSAVVPPAWAVRAVYASVTGGNAAGPLLVCVAATAAEFLVAGVLLGMTERAARSSATAYTS